MAQLSVQQKLAILADAAKYVDGHDQQDPRRAAHLKRIRERAEALTA